MRQYPIWNDVNTDAYTTPKSFGARGHYSQTVNVGTSRSNSHELANIEVSHSNMPDGSQLFVLYVDGIEIKSAIVKNGESAVTYSKALLNGAESIPPYISR